MAQGSEGLALCHPPAQTGSRFSALLPAPEPVRWIQPRTACHGAEAPSLRGMGAPTRGSWAGALCTPQRGPTRAPPPQPWMDPEELPRFPQTALCSITQLSNLAGVYGLFSTFLGLTGSSNARSLVSDTKYSPVATQDVE